MGHDVLSKGGYQYIDKGFLVDNGPWQEEIKKRIERQAVVKSDESWPTLGVNEFQPVYLPENPEAEGVFKTPSSADLLASVLADEEEEGKSIKKNAYEMVEKARLETEEILRNAREEAEKEAIGIKGIAAEQGRQDGFEKGKEEGLAQGLAEGKNSYVDLVKSLNAVLGSLAEERKKIIADFQPLLVELVGESLKRCLKKESENGLMVVEFVNEVLRKAQDRVDLKLHLNPADVAEIESRKEELQLSVGTGGLTIVPDARIERGGCLLETEAGSVDARLSTIVGQMQESLTSELKK